MKRIFSSLGLLGILLITLGIPTYAEGNSLIITVDHNAGLVGEEVTVNIAGNNLTDIAGADLVITYDSSKLEFIEKTISIRDVIDIQLHRDDNNDLMDEDGMIKILFGLNKDAELLQGDVHIARIKFKNIDIGSASIGFGSTSQLVKETNNGTIDYAYTNPQLSDNLTVDISKLAKLSGVITGSDHYEMAGAIILLKKDGVEVHSSILELEGLYEFKNLEDGTYTIEVFHPGYETYTQELLVLNGEDEESNMILNRINVDTDRNGGIELEDLVFVARRFGLSSGDTGWSSDADVNGDQVIDMLDLVQITRLLQ